MSISDSAKGPSASGSAATNFPEFVAAGCCPSYCPSTTAAYAASPSRCCSPNSCDSLAGVAPVVLASAYFAASLAPSCCYSAYSIAVAAAAAAAVSATADATADATAVAAATSRPTSSCCCSSLYRYWYRTISAVGHRQVPNAAVACAVAGAVAVAEPPAAAAIDSVLVADPFLRSLDIR